MECPFCHSPAGMKTGASYTLSEEDELLVGEYQCGLPEGSPEDACGKTFFIMDGDGYLVRKILG